MNRALLRASVVPLTHEPQDDLSRHTTVAERLALVAEMSAEMWTLAGKTLTFYTRSDMPVAVRALRADEA